MVCCSPSHGQNPGHLLPSILGFQSMASLRSREPSNEARHRQQCLLAGIAAKRLAQAARSTVSISQPASNHQEHHLEGLEDDVSSPEKDMKPPARLAHGRLRRHADQSPPRPAPARNVDALADDLGSMSITKPGPFASVIGQECASSCATFEAA